MAADDGVARGDRVVPFDGKASCARRAQSPMFGLTRPHRRVGPDTHPIGYRRHPRPRGMPDRWARRRLVAPPQDQRRGPMSTAQQVTEDELNARRSRTVVWVVTISTIGLIFDGYDLVVYGAVVSTFLKDPTQIGEVTPALAGTLGSYALIGTLVGALLAGSVGDIIGRRKVMLTAYAWFSVGMLITALTSTATML